MLPSFGNYCLVLLKLWFYFLTAELLNIEVQSSKNGKIEYLGHFEVIPRYHFTVFSWVKMDVIVMEWDKVTHEQP